MSSPERAAAPLANRAFRALWLASLCSFVGSRIQEVGEAWLMMSLTTSPLLVALLTTCNTLPTLVLGFPAGVLADRVDRRSLLIATQVWAAAVALALAVVAWAGMASSAFLLVAAAALGIGSAMSGPAWQSQLTDIVERRHTADAVTLNAVAFQASRAMGPAIGGLVLGVLNPGTAFFLNGVSYLGVIEALRRHGARTAERANAGESFLAAVRTAFRAVQRSPELRRCYAAVAGFACACGGVVALLPTYAKWSLGAGPRGYGLLLAAQGVGSLLGALALRHIRTRVSARALVAAGMLIYGACALLMSGVRELPLAVMLYVPAGAGTISAFTTMNALVQLNSPRMVKSRVIALYQIAFLGTWSVGAAVAGTVASRFGAAPTLSLFALGALLAAAFTALNGLPEYELA